MPIHGATCETPEGIVHVRRLLISGALSPLLLLGSTSALAASAQPRWGPWKPIPRAAPFTFRDCGTIIRATNPVADAEQRTLTDAQGNVHIETRGPLRLLLRTRDGQKAMVDASGRNYNIAFKDGAFLFTGTGANFVGLTQTEHMGHAALPLAFQADGPLSLFFTPNDHLIIGRLPTHIRNVCALLHKDTQVFTVRTAQTSFTQHGRSISFTDRLSQGGRVVGNDAVTCKATSGSESHCHGVFSFKQGPGRGDLFAAVTFRGRPGNSFRIHITSGTGTFTGDTGYDLVRDTGPKTAIDTFHLDVSNASGTGALVSRASRGADGASGDTRVA